MNEILRAVSLLTLMIAMVAVDAIAAPDRESVLRQEIPRLKTDYRAAELQGLLRETELSRAYYELLNRYVRYVRPNLRPWPIEPGASFHKRDGSKEHDIRQNGTVAMALAVLSTNGRFDEKVAGASREQVRADALGLVRYLAVTHVANFRPTGDGKSWGDHWQSALWTMYAGSAAWLLWDELPDDTKVMAARMVIHEADRFNERPPDDGEWKDTKAEENAWNSAAPALASAMFPNHPHAALWRERAIVYMLNSFSTRADHADSSIVDGRSVKERVTTVCLHDDFTLENHGHVHPDYLGTFSSSLRNAIFFRLGGQPIPQATFHHAGEVFRVLAHLTAPNGGLFYVNGQDWWPHRHDVSLKAGGLVSVLMQDPQAARIERDTLAWLQKMHARFDDGRSYDPREYNYPNAEEETMARYAELYLAHRLFGDGPKPASARAFAAKQSGARLFEIGGFVTHRTADKFASFTWANGAMGLVYPEGDTWFTSPNERGLIGRLNIAGAKDTPPQLLAKNVRVINTGRAGVGDGFGFVGKFARCEGRIEQTAAMISLPGAPVVYVERLRALTNVDVREISTGLIAVLNEEAKPLTRNVRVISTAAGRHVATGAATETATVHAWQTDWANVDDRLGIVARASGQMGYVETHKYERSRLQQELAANQLMNVRSRQAGKMISQAVVGLLPNARHSRKLALESGPISERGVAVIFEGWFVAVNLSERELVGEAFGKAIKLPALGVSIARLK